MAEKKKPAVKTGKKKHGVWRKRLFWGFGWLLCLLTVTGFFGALGWWVDLTAHFRLQYAALLLVWLALAVWYLRWLSALAFGTMLLVNLALLAPYLWYPEDRPGHYKLLSANIDYENPDLARVEKYVLQENPDFAVLVEVRLDWRTRMPKLAAAYPYCYEGIETKPSRIVILSRYPARKMHPLRTWDYNPGLFAEMTLGGRNFTLVGIHPSSPKLHRDHQDRKLQYLQLAYFFTQVPDGELLVAGDFNTTPWSYFYRILTARVPFKSALREFGLHLTYPSWPAVLGVPIDQVVHTEKIEIRSLRRGEDIGSDHYPLVTEFDLTPLPSGVSAAVPGPGVPTRR